MEEPVEEVGRRRRASVKRFCTAMEAIIQKYSRQSDGNSDVLDLVSGEIIEDHGTLRTMAAAPFSYAVQMFAPRPARLPAPDARVRGRSKVSGDADDGEGGEDDLLADWEADGGESGAVRQQAEAEALQRHKQQVAASQQAQMDEVDDFSSGPEDDDVAAELLAQLAEINGAEFADESDTDSVTSGFSNWPVLEATSQEQHHQPRVKRRKRDMRHAREMHEQGQAAVQVAQRGAVPASVLPSESGQMRVVLTAGAGCNGGNCQKRFCFHCASESAALLQPTLPPAFFSKSRATFSSANHAAAASFLLSAQQNSSSTTTSGGDTTDSIASGES